MIPSFLLNFIISAKDVSLLIGNSYLNLCLLNLSYIPVYHSPVDETLLIRTTFEKNFVLENILKIILNTGNTPSVFSKIFLYNFINFSYPKYRVPFYFYEKLGSLNHNYIESLVQMIQSKTTYENNLLYFYPIENKFAKFINVLLSITSFREFIGFNHKICEFFNYLLIRFKFIDYKYFKNNINYASFKHFYKHKFYESIYLYNHQENSQLITYLNNFLQQESNNLFNFFVQFIVQMQTIVSNMINAEAVKKIFEILDTLNPLGLFGKSNRQLMFKDRHKPVSLRKTILSAANERSVLLYLNAFNNLENQYQLLNKKKKIFKKKNNKEKLKKINKEIKKIKFPKLLIVGLKSEYFGYKLIDQVNTILKTYPVFFDCVALKKSLNYLSKDPQASKNSFLMHLFELIKKNYQLKKLFSDTKKKKYRLDMLVFDGIDILLKNRFGKLNLTINDFISVTMFLGYLPDINSYRSSVILTIPNIEKGDLDVSTMKNIDHYIKLEEVDQKKNKIKLKLLMLDLYKKNFFKYADITPKELLKWCMKQLEDDLNVNVLFVFFEQVLMLTKQQKMILNINLLNIIAQHMQIQKKNI